MDRLKKKKVVLFKRKHFESRFLNLFFSNSYKYTKKINKINYTIPTNSPDTT